MARRPARLSIWTRLWPWAPPSNVSSQSGLGQGDLWQDAQQSCQSRRAVAMGAAIQGEFTIRIRARRSSARLSIRMRRWPWAPPSRVSSQSGSGQGGQPRHELLISAKKGSATRVLRIETFIMRMRILIHILDLVYCDKILRIPIPEAKNSLL